MPSSAETSTESLPPEIRSVVESFAGELYFAAVNLETGRRLDFRPDERVQTASVIKIPIMIEVFAQVDQGHLRLDGKLRLDEENRVPGAGILQDLTPGLEITLLDGVTLMIVLSDNTATNLVIDRVGIDAVNSRLARLGLRETFLNKKVYKDGPPDLPKERAAYGLGVTTPAEMLTLVEKLYRNEVASTEGCRRMIEILEKQRDRDQIPRLLVGPGWEGIRTATKTGALNQVRNDVGIVFTPQGDVALSLFAQNSPDQSWTPDNQATLVLARLAELLVGHLLAPR